MNDSNDESEMYKIQAKYFVSYFEGHVNSPTSSSSRDWETGLDIAQQWILMLESTDTPNIQDVEDLLARAEAYSSTGSAAVDMHLSVSAWYRDLSEFD